MPGIKPPEGTVSAQAEKLRQALIEVSRISTELQDQLRQLLSYCREQGETSALVYSADAYADVADKLAGLLDGES